MAVFSGSRRRMVAMPLGGIGTGNLAISGTGVLKQWQLHNTGNHLGFLPQSLFALRLATVEPPHSYRRVLQAPSVEPQLPPAPLVNDGVDTLDAQSPKLRWSGVRGSTFNGAYPFARIEYDDAWPADVRAEAYTPFVPLDDEASGLPLASFTLSVTNRHAHELHGWLLGTLQNAVGWDGVTPIRDARCAILGGNVNRVATVSGGTAILMGNEQFGGLDRGAGSMALWTKGQAVPLPQFDDVDAALAFVDALKLLGPIVFDDWSADAMSRAMQALRPDVRWPDGPSQPGSTWSGGLAVPFHLAPGETVNVPFVYAWHFPNRYADFDRFGDSDNASPAEWIGNHYTTRFADAEDVLNHFAEHEPDLRKRTVSWHDALYGSSLPPVVVDVLGAQPSLIRSPTTFRTADGRFFGFEGVLGESTLNWNGNIGGSCPLNCTHVWNYEQAVARLFPRLERSMRETDWDVMQAPAGYLPHRVLLPIDGRQLHGVPIGGPTRPALDGMLGTILKTYREVRQGAGQAWLERYLPKAQLLMEYVTATWDTAGSGVLTGDQPVTHDISLHGPNMYVGGLWLAALRTMQEITALLGSASQSQSYAERFRLASRAYDALLWNGEYYIQQSDGEAFDFGSGCLSDQLFGQLWAHQLDLGYLLPAEHVVTALRSVVRYNMRHGFRDFENSYRVFADADDSGLLICTWPNGGRPDVPIRYADEVWTGVEYQVGAHCLHEGLIDEGTAVLKALRARYDGSRRNPYNEVECGDHYARAMAGWGVLDAMTGATYDAWSERLRLGRSIDRYPLLAGTGWGVVAAGDRLVSFQCLGGSVAVSELTVHGADIAEVWLDGSVVNDRVIVPDGSEIVAVLGT